MQLGYTKLHLKKNNDFTMYVFNDLEEHVITIEGYAEIDNKEVTFFVVSKVCDSCRNELPNFISKDWVVSEIENKLK